MKFESSRRIFITCGYLLLPSLSAYAEPFRAWLSEDTSGELLMNFDSQPDMQYRLETSSDLDHWDWSAEVSATSG